MQSQPLDERRLVTVSAFKSLVVPDTKRYGDNDDAYSICAVVSRSSAFREVKSNKRAKPYYYVDFDIADDSCDEVLGVKLWGDVARFEQLRHQLVKGALVLLQSVSLRKDCYRNNKLTIQEHRYGYSSCIYIVERNPQSSASASSSGSSHTYYLDRGNTTFPTVQLFDGRFVALAARIEKLESWSKASSTFHSSANLVKSGFASSFVDALEVAPSTDGVIDLCVTLDVAVVEVQCVGAIKEDNKGKRVVLYDGFAPSKAGAGATIEVMDLGGRKASGLVDGGARTKLEMMLCEVLGAECARPGISSVVEGGAEVTAGATSSSGNNDDNCRNLVRETLTVLIQAARVRRSSEGVVVVLHMDAQASFFGFNDAHGSHTHHMMALENAQSLSFGDFLKAVMSPSSTSSSQLFRVRCLLREVAFADWAVQSLPVAGADTLGGHDFNGSAEAAAARAAAAGAGAGGPQLKVMLSRMLETTRYGTHMEVRYRDAIFSLGATQPPPQAQAQSLRGEQKGKRDDNAMMPEPLSPQSAKEARHSSTSKNLNELPPPVSKSPPPSDPFVYSVPLSAATMPPSAASAHSQTTTTTTIGHGRGGYYHHPPQNMNTNPNPNSCSQLHSYYSQAQPPVALQQSQEENAWVAVLVKDAVLTEIFSNIPCGLAAACLAKEEHENNASSSSSSGGSNLDQLSHNYAESVRQLASSLVRSAALGDGLEVECVLEVLPRNDENDAMLGKQHLCIMQSFNVAV